MPRNQRTLQTTYNEGGSMQTAFQVVLVDQNPPHPPVAPPPTKKCRATKKKSTTVPATGEGGASSPATPRRQGQAASDPTHQTRPSSTLAPVAELPPIIETAPEQPLRLHRLWMTYFQTLLLLKDHQQLQVLLGLNHLAPPVRHPQHEIAQILHWAGLRVHQGLGATADHAVRLTPEERASEIQPRMFTLFFLLMPSVSIACSAANPMIEVVSYADTTSTTVLCKHLANNHLATWVQGCDQLNISILSSGKMKKVIEDYRRQEKSQGSPESANEKPDQPQTEFSPEAFIDAIMEFVVGNDQSLNVVESPELHRIFVMLREELCDSDIPHRSKMRDRIMEVYKEHLEVLKSDMEKALGKISYTSGKSLLP
ncbi:hypothetical protein K443DRAFT_5808 [Laccaria amethystina LaAM-08-1]|uniref:Uncharacterized protein n=1 Tax=Laccaria amethystina LaAM-08-1 TaxID=1095629 RepID=A0A0C9XDJ8_9AGAR|nr:hypothetical protein K443DRAFT_5808 [Laccaria amethystina LaAM-08-1]